MNERGADDVVGLMSDEKPSRSIAFHCSKIFRGFAAAKDRYSM